MVLSFLKCVARVVLKCGLNAVTFGAGGELLDTLWVEWSRQADAQQRRQELETLARMSNQEAGQQAAAAVAEEAGKEPVELQLLLTSYLTQMPAQVRRSLRRPSDPDGTTVTPELEPKRAEDLKTLLPERLPRFRTGDRPLPGVPWVLQGLLGIGGFGEVWKAGHVQFPGLQAALKFCLDPAAQERLLHHEARMVLQVQAQGKHPGMVELRQVYLDPDPPCLEYEYIDGGELTDWVKPETVNPRQASQIILELARAVGFAHRLTPAVVHRDLKPANILMRKNADGSATTKIADFGIGGLIGPQPLPAGTSRPTAVGGAYTQIYASPQQRRGLAPDPRDDVYSLGVIWYQLLIGDWSAEPPSGRGWRKRLTDRGVDPRCLDLLETCFEYEPTDRPADAAVLADLLAAIPGDQAPHESVPVKVPVDIEAIMADAAEQTLSEAFTGFATLPADIRRHATKLIGHNEEAMTAAAEWLVASDQRQAWEVLVALDLSWPTEVKERTARALDRLIANGEIAGVEPRIAQRIVEALGRSQGGKTVSALRAALAHPSPRVRGAAFDALERQGIGPASREEQRLRALIRQDWQALHKIGHGEVVSILARQLSNPDWYSRQEAAKGLGELGDRRALKPLIAALQDEAEGVRGTAAEALGTIGDPDGVPALIQTLGDEKDWVRRCATDALGVLGDARALDGLRRMLKELDVSNRNAGVLAVAKIGGATAVPLLAAALADPDAEVRQEAVLGLESIGGPEAAKAIARALADEEGTVAATAATALARLGVAADAAEWLAEMLRARDPKVRKAAAEALQAAAFEPRDRRERAYLAAALGNIHEVAEFAEDGVDALILTLETGDDYVQQTAAERLGLLLDSRCVPALVRALENGYLTVRSAAAIALGRIRDPGAYPALQAAVAADDLHVSEPAGEALEKVRAARGSDPLVMALADDEPQVAIRAACLLSRRGDQRGFDTFRAFLQGEDSVSGCRAVLALRTIEGEKAVETLLLGLVRGYAGSDAVAALVERGAAAVPALVRFATSPGTTHNPRWEAFRALVQIGAAAFDALATALPAARRDAKITACEVLGRMAKQAPTRALVPLLGDPDSEVRRYAKHALALHGWNGEENKSGS